MLKDLHTLAEEIGFEPTRRCYRPTGIRSRTLQPLGYSSILTPPRLAASYIVTYYLVSWKNITACFVFFYQAVT